MAMAASEYRDPQDLINAAGRGDLQRAQSLIDEGCNVNGRGQYDYASNSTALHAASGKGHADVAEVLIKHGADVNAKDEIERTSLHYAVRNGHEATTRLLLQSKAFVDAKDNRGETPLDVADGRKVKSLLKAAKRKATMEAEFSVLMKESGVTRNSSKINVCGFGGVGKTTLLKSLQRGFLEAYFTRRSEERAPPPDKTTHIPTPGIEVNIVNIPKAGKYRAWDFAGQPEYYVTHNMFLRADDSLFLVVFKIMDVIDDFDGTLTEELLTWPRFIKSRISDDQRSENKPTVILVASGADMVEKLLQDNATKVVEDIRAQIQVMFEEYLNILDETFLLNCHDSRHKDMDRLRKCLSNCKRKNRYLNFVRRLPILRTNGKSTISSHMVLACLCGTSEENRSLGRGRFPHNGYILS
ncbi:death-associated protein kinase 1-like [Ptychodera flava]|uniref:death-associated protein kinase 1-like n=1 Tax=Ptychodera flava TaxID=63121 RepID=UPI00396A57B3